MGRNWQGQFRLVLTDEQGEELSAVELNPFFPHEELIFNELFEFVLEDYNGDGRWTLRSVNTAPVTAM